MDVWPRGNTVFLKLRYKIQGQYKQRSGASEFKNLKWFRLQIISGWKLQTLMLVLLLCILSQIQPQEQGVCVCVCVCVRARKT